VNLNQLQFQAEEGLRDFKSFSDEIKFNCFNQNKEIIIILLSLDESAIKQWGNSQKL